MSDLDKKLAGIELVIFDVDGVMTDGTVWVDVDGRESIRFNIHDAYGIFRGYRVGLQYAIISGRQCEAVEHRARVLRITQVHQGQSLKQEAFEKVMSETGLETEQIAYMGDDLNDLPIMEQVGLSCCVANGRSEVKEAADLVTEARGGEGAVREFLEMIITARGGVSGP
jgi:3-deoxy-D-manno-octulosonate 8-phosphate phosphatase (KDO 8-P phosphatase)